MSMPYPFHKVNLAEIKLGIARSALAYFVPHSRSLTQDTLARHSFHVAAPPQKLIALSIPHSPHIHPLTCLTFTRSSRHLPSPPSTFERHFVRTSYSQSCSTVRRAHVLLIHVLYDFEHARRVTELSPRDSSDCSWSPPKLPKEQNCRDTGVMTRPMGLTILLLQRVTRLTPPGSGNPASVLPTPASCLW